MLGFGFWVFVGFERVWGGGVGLAPLVVLFDACFVQTQARSRGGQRRRPPRPGKKQQTSALLSLPHPPIHILPHPSIPPLHLSLSLSPPSLPPLTARPHVDAKRVARRPQQDLGRAVPSGRDVVRQHRAGAAAGAAARTTSTSCSGGGVGRQLRDGAREAEVGELDLALAVEQQVGRLLVWMDV